MTNKRKKGSIVLFAMIFAAIMCMVAGSYLMTADNGFRMSSRSVNYNRAIDLAEAGVDQAMWAINNGEASVTDGWTLDSDTGALTRTFFTSSSTTLHFEGNVTGETYVRIDNPSSHTPTVTAMGYVRIPNAAPIKKQIRVGLKYSGFFPAGLVSKSGIALNGTNPVIDSYDSSKGPWNATTNRNDKPAVAALVGGISIGNAEIYGTTAVGGSSKSLVTVGSNGTLTNSTTPPGVTFDQNLISTGFSMNLPPPATPSDSGSTFGVPLNNSSFNGNLILGVAGATAPTYYYYSGDPVSLTSSSSTVTVVGPVVLVLNSDLKTSGNGQILVENTGNASLTMYVSGDASISGNGLVNQNPAANTLTIYATGTKSGAAKTFDVKGNGDTTALLYAPDYSVSVSGNGAWNGSIVGNYVDFGGNGGMHYDEQSANISGARHLYGVGSWVDLNGKAGTIYAMDTRTPFNF